MNLLYADGIQEFVDRCNAAMPADFYKLPLSEQRQLYLNLNKVFPYTVESSIKTQDIHFSSEIPPVRVYTPKGCCHRGLIVYIRRGGFVVGSLETHHSLVAELAHKTATQVIALNFRMAPEHKFPLGLNDCYDALCDIVKNASTYGVDADNIVLCGDSSGANMAVSLVMMCRDRNGPRISAQALISPVLDFSRWMKDGKDSPLLTAGEMEYYVDCYLKNSEDVYHPYVSQLLSADFNNLPPAYIMGAEMDPLVVDAEKYAKLLSEQGIKTELNIEKGLVHSAMRARGLSQSVSKAWDKFCNKCVELLEEGRDHA
ncbi:alpha/beta hydrolase [Facilibium subflavum]|uniref:alpha/beta hydrolase n=1 Tax=Facilibium subflavum TaxID=2219058 RepID=UPI000E65967D|nr:alpha/beta hydrolase [Facilibium subflavum]